MRIKGVLVRDGARSPSFARWKEEWGADARSGLGSREETTREPNPKCDGGSQRPPSGHSDAILACIILRFRVFLESFLRDHSVRSVVDAGAKAGSRLCLAEPCSASSFASRLWALALRVPEVHELAGRAENSGIAGCRSGDGSVIMFFGTRHYTGIDVVPYVVAENAAYFQEIRR